ncbi:MAG: DNA mismatch repair endonuclease MutL [Oscillospiraceae bacterium]
MPKINLLDKSVYELIAAGEVIERPSSVIKELCENSIDAGATSISVEIKRGGISYIRVTDNGCGIAYEDMPSAFVRHATSKVFTADDLDNINTLGFRGEALASVCAVGRVECVSKQSADKLGTLYRIEGGECTEYDRTGGADGTSIIIRDLFFNTPARLKFLKKDVTEGNYCAGVVEKLALSHPGISFRFIRDGRQTMLTHGDGEYYSAVSAVFGKQFAAGLIPVENIYRDTSVTGFVSSPLFTRANRTMQHFFVNGRSVKSPLCCAALEEAFRNSIMVGKFPACVLCINTDPAKIDANIHPTKTEVRFTEEKTVFDAVYFAVKNALLGDDEKREIKLPQNERQFPEKAPERPAPTAPPTTIVQTVRDEPQAAPVPSEKPDITYPDVKAQLPKFTLRQEQPYMIKAEPVEAVQQVLAEVSKPASPEVKKEVPLSQLPGFAFLSDKSFAKKEQPAEPEKPAEPEFVPERVRVVGELFRTYIVCEGEEDMLLIDKHAAHERINFERLKKGFSSSAQFLIEPAEVYLSAEEYSGLSEFSDRLADVGIVLDFGDGGRVTVLALPQLLDRENPADIVESIAKTAAKGNSNIKGELFDDMLHTAACRMSIKANDVNDIAELQAIAEEVVSNRDIRFCPHGRPVCTKISKRQIEKYFSRIV